MGEIKKETTYLTRSYIYWNEVVVLGINLLIIKAPIQIGLKDLSVEAIIRINGYLSQSTLKESRSFTIGAITI